MFWKQEEKLKNGVKMASKAERKEEWENRQNKGRDNETWVKVKENTKAIRLNI